MNLVDMISPAPPVTPDLRRLAKSLQDPPAPRGSCRRDAESILGPLIALGRRIGITRIGDLTGLDLAELPVAQAVRPAALSEVTSLGKGWTLAEAAVGCVMESLERFYAECVESGKVTSATANELDIAEGSYASHLANPGASDWHDVRIPWISGLDLTEHRVVPVPYELVHTRYTRPPPPGDGVFIRTTTGLACHTTAIDAVSHGLLECVERDAMARAFETHGFFDRMRVRFTGLSQDMADLLKRLAEIHVSVAFWQAPSPTGVHVIWCQTIECGPGEPLLALPTEGYSAGFTLEAAVRGALLEAVSARAGAISGAREDQTRRHYRRSSDELVVRARELIAEGEGTAQLHNISRAEVLSHDTLVERIVDARLGPIVAVPLGFDEDAAVACVRVVLAGAASLNKVR